MKSPSRSSGDNGRFSQACPNTEDLPVSLTGCAAWPPYGIDLTPLLNEAGNELTLEVFGTRRNTFGPLHFSDPDPPSIGPAHFVSEGDEWTDDYVLKPAGLLAHPVLLFQQEA